MRAGKYKHRITIRNHVSSSGKYGRNKSNMNVPIVLATLWAQVIGKSGIESHKDDKTISTVFYEIKIRFRNDINNTQTILFDNLVLNILTAFDKTGRMRELTILCSSE